MALIPPELDEQVCSTAFCVLRANPQLIDPEYLFHAVCDPRFVEAVSARQRGTGYPAVTDSDVIAESVALPPLDEQRAIARILSTIQRGLDAADRIITSTTQLRTSLAQHLFTYGPIEVEKTKTIVLKDTEVGPIPEHWEISQLSGISSGSFRNGAFVKRPTWGSGTRYLNVADVYPQAVVQPEVLPRIMVSPEAYKGFLMEPGDLVFVRSSLKREGVAKACIVLSISEPVIFDCHLIRLTPNQSLIHPRFLVEYCRWPSAHDRLVSLSKTTTMTTIPQDNLAKFTLPVPPLGEQQEIAQTLEAFDRRIATESVRAQALNKVFQTALRTLLTAQIRIGDTVAASK